MENANRQSGRLHRIVALAIGVVLLGVFTVMTIGMSGKSDAEMVREVARDSQFANTERFAILPEKFGQTSQRSFSQKVRTYSDEAVVCGASRTQFDEIVKRTGLRSEQVREQNRNIAFVKVTKDTSADEVSQAFSVDGKFEVKCKTINTTRFFFFQTSPQISSVALRA